MRQNNRARKRIIERVHKQIQLLNEVSRFALGEDTAGPPQLDLLSVRDLLRSARTAARLLQDKKLALARKKL